MCTLCCGRKFKWNEKAITPGSNFFKAQVHKTGLKLHVQGTAFHFDRCEYFMRFTRCADKRSDSGDESLWLSDSQRTSFAASQRHFYECAHACTLILPNPLALFLVEQNPLAAKLCSASMDRLLVLMEVATAFLYPWQYPIPFDFRSKYLADFCASIANFCGDARFQQKWIFSPSPKQNTYHFNFLSTSLNLLSQKFNSSKYGLCFLRRDRLFVAKCLHWANLWAPIKSLDTGRQLAIVTFESLIWPSRQ